MRNETVERIGDLRVVLMDSISLTGPQDQGAIIMCGSHGGAISGAFAARHPPALVVFNDAGGGKRAAGIACLDMLDRAGVPAATVSHRSARIGDARDTWENGVISHCNAAARHLGLKPQDSARAAARAVGAKREPRR